MCACLFRAIVPSQCTAQEVCGRNDAHAVVHPHVYVLPPSCDCPVRHHVCLPNRSFSPFRMTRLLRLPVQLPARAAQLQPSFLAGRVRSPPPFVQVRTRGDERCGSRTLHHQVSAASGVRLVHPRPSWSSLVPPSTGTCARNFSASLPLPVIDTLTFSPSTSPQFLPDKYDYQRPVHVDAEQGESKECVICMSVVLPNQRDYMVTPCNHLFHQNCLEQWMVRIIIIIAPTNQPHTTRRSQN